MAPVIPVFDEKKTRKLRSTGWSSGHPALILSQTFIFKFGVDGTEDGQTSVFLLTGLRSVSTNPEICETH